MDNFITVSPQNARADYERVISAVAASMGVSADQIKQKYKVSPMTLKLGAILNTATGMYDFYPVQGAGVARPLSQIQINKNDWFAITNMGLGFSKMDFVSATNTYSNGGNFPILSFPDPNYFAGTPAGATTEAASLYTVINGTVEATVSADPVLLPTPARDYVFNPESSYLGTPVALPKLGPDKINRGYAELTPHIILDGNSDNVFKVVLADGSKTDIDGATSPGTTAATTRNVLWLFLNGWVIKSMADGGMKCDVNRV